VSEYQALYRILTIERLIAIFRQKSLYLPNPTAWTDPYELRFHDRNFARVFALCWTTNPVSDAMWQVYSPSSTGVRIRVRRNVLAAEIVRHLRRGWRLKLANVEYVRQQELESRT